MGRREKNGRHFPRIKRESWCSMANPIQPLAGATDAAATAAAFVPAATVVLVPFVLSLISPNFSSFTSTNVPGPSSHRIGVTLPLFPGSKGYVGAHHRPKPSCSSDTDLVTAGSSPMLSLLHLLGVCVVPSKSPAIPPQESPP